MYVHACVRVCVRTCTHAYTHPTPTISMPNAHRLASKVCALGSKPQLSRAGALHGPERGSPQQEGRAQPCAQRLWEPQQGQAQPGLGGACGGSRRPV